MNILNISTEEVTRPMTKTSSFLRFLVKSCFITIKKSDDRIKFSFQKLMVYLLGAFGWYVSMVILSQVNGMYDSFENNNQVLLGLTISIFVTYFY